MPRLVVVAMGPHKAPLRHPNRVIWLVSAMPAKAPRAFSCSMWVLDSLLQQVENSSTEMKVLPFRFSTVSWAAVSPRPRTEMKGGSRPLSVILKAVAWDS